MATPKSPLALGISLESCLGRPRRVQRPVLSSLEVRPRSRAKDGDFPFCFLFFGGASDFLQTLLSWDLAHHASLGNPIRPSRVGAARRPFDSPNLLLEANNPKGRSRHRPIRDSVVKSSFGHKVVRTQISSDKKGERVGPNTRSRNRFDLSF
jgi:hypothetical protein